MSLDVLHRVMLHLLFLALLQKYGANMDISLYDIIRKSIRW